MAKAREELTWPTEERRLLPLLPIIYVAWADGDLTPAEMGGISARVQGFDWLDDSSKALVSRWLDPNAPPTPQQLAGLLSTIRRHAGKLSGTARSSLVDLGLELAGAEGGGGGSEGELGWATPEVCEALADIEGALGDAGAEACRELLVVDGRRPEVVAKEPAAAFDVAALTRLLDGEYRETRESLRSTLREPAFRYRYGLDRHAYRELVLG